MKTRAALCATALAWLTTAVSAAPLQLPPDARNTATSTQNITGFALPVAPFSAGAMQTRLLDGVATADAWRFALNGKTTTDIANAIRDQLREAGYTILLDCADERCGGFDFRYQLYLLPEPDMHVDLGDFRFLSATGPAGSPAPNHLQIVVSRSPANGFVQITSLSPADTSTPLVTGTKTPSARDVVGPTSNTPLSEHLLELGYAVLEGLRFGSGSSSLTTETSDPTAELAEFLQNNPDLTVALVGHTDARGAQSTNLALSRARAQAVLDRLVSTYGISRNRLAADGVGFLAPRASNLTKEGREKNRRVEVVVTSTR